MGELVIGGKRISDTSDCYVIAEIGQNHQGSLETCMALFRAAKDCGVDAVKLQKRDNRNLYTRVLYDAPYDNENSFGPTYGRHREALEFDHDQYRTLKDCARNLDLDLVVTAWDFNSADFLAELGVAAFKMASGDLKTIPLLRHVAQFGKPMILSTGGGTLEDIQRAYDAVMPINPRLCFLQCTAAYPADHGHLNLRVISRLRELFPELVVGLSDHENGIAMAVVAYMLGARVVEKHFTLNHTWKGTDHAFSLEPTGMRKLVRDLRRVPAALGDGHKRVYPEEVAPLRKMGKSIVAARDLAAGHVLAETDLAYKSPADGIPPHDACLLLGKALNRPVAADDFLNPDMVR